MDKSLEKNYEEKFNKLEEKEMAQEKIKSILEIDEEKINIHFVK